MPWEEKFKTPVRVFKGTFSIMTFNELPACLEPIAPHHETKSAQELREPFVNRCTYHKTRLIYDSPKFSFPYDDNDLALYLLERYMEKM